MPENNESSKTIYPCRVCGLDQGEDLYYSRDICDCCGCEFGTHDLTREQVASVRMDWLTKGATWFDNKMKPENWNSIEDLTNQLKNIPFEWW